MRITVLLLGTVLATSAGAQTSNDDQSATENWWDKVGAGFFSDAGLKVERPEYEIRAQWTGLSADDQAAVRARCAAAAGSGSGLAPSLQEGDEDEDPDTTQVERTDRTRPTPRPAESVEDRADAAADAATTTTGSVAGAEVQLADESGKIEPYTGLAGSPSEGEARMVRVCDLIADL